MLRLTTLAFFVVLFVCGHSAATADVLKPKYEAARLLIAAEEAIDQQQFSQAKQHLAQVAALNIAPPTEYYYFHGVVLAHGNDNRQAREAFKRYVNSSGEQGRFYRQSLQSITVLAQKPQSNGGSQHSITWHDSDGEQPADNGYVAKLQDLYKAQQPNLALVTHINSLLKFYALPIKHNTARQYHQLKLSNKQLITQLKQEASEQRSPLNDARSNQTRFNVYGVNPYVESACGKDLKHKESCWVVDPHTGSPWLRIQPNKDGIEEIAKALTLLIKRLQN